MSVGRGGSWIAPRALVVLAVGGVLAACASNDKPPEVKNIPPLNYKGEITFEVSRSLGDPTNIRGAFYSEPVFDPNGSIKHYYSCVRFNPRDPGTPRYLGSRDYIAHYFDGRLNQFVEATKEQCGTAAYKPFPELEKLCYGYKCL